jgi:phosphoribosylpyrophosphate synthetase
MGKECKRDKDFRVRHFPDNIRDLLCLLVDDENNTATIILNTCDDCVQENVEVVSVIGNLAVFRCQDKFKFVDIHCICEVIVDCETILTELLESNNECRC